MAARSPTTASAWSVRSGGSVQADDDDGDVVVGPAGDVEAGEEGVGEVFRAEVGAGGERGGQAGQAGVDVLTTAFDQAVGVEDEGVAWGVGHVGLGAGDVFGAGAQR